ncbi:MAG TPA: RluA family pseudouridine synthase [Phycisphaerae bacterium]|nr:RluA family pseudouridine synthase [Phycisphaerae bacterium]
MQNLDTEADFPEDFDGTDGDEPQSVEISEDGLDAVETSFDAEEDGLRHVRVEIRRLKENKRIDKYLSHRLGKGVSRTALQKYIAEGIVKVNGRTVKCSYNLRVGDAVDMMLPETRPKEIPAEPIPLDVVYEDEDMMAINKQANLIIHPARGNWSGTLVNALAYYFQANWRTGQSINDLPCNGEKFRPGIVHRLDRDTTGIILIAKTDLALWRLGRQFEDRSTSKTYSAIVHGLLDFDEDIIDMPIGKHPKYREKYAVHRDTGKPHPITVKSAVTRYKVVERLQPKGTDMGFTLVELHPKTGRTHQLRVHMSAIGHPMVGDRMYGGGPLYISQLDGHAEVAEGPLITRQALHAHTIEFYHPRTNERMSLTAPWPKDFEDTLAELRRRCK